MPHNQTKYLFNKTITCAHCTSVCFYYGDTILESKAPNILEHDKMIIRTFINTLNSAVKKQRSRCMQWRVTCLFLLRRCSTRTNQKHNTSWKFINPLKRDVIKQKKACYAIAVLRLHPQWIN